MRGFRRASCDHAHARGHRVNVDLVCHELTALLLPKLAVRAHDARVHGKQELAEAVIRGARAVAASGERSIHPALEADNGFTGRGLRAAGGEHAADRVEEGLDGLGFVHAVCRQHEVDRRARARALSSRPLEPPWNPPRPRKCGSVAHKGPARPVPVPDVHDVGQAVFAGVLCAELEGLQVRVRGVHSRASEPRGERALQARARAEHEHGSTLQGRAVCEHPVAHEHASRPHLETDIPHGSRRAGVPHGEGLQRGGHLGATAFPHKADVAILVQEHLVPGEPGNAGPRAKQA
mmetsp:Transcript_9485/g.32145  ORF Transcript_9485/g.32145 Transcript_9485/m.32145 type:complete len:292 (+) Transcript_9485:1264-2139(+)